MPALDNPRQEAFARLLAYGDNGTPVPKSTAYTLAGYQPDDGHSSRLAGNGRVETRVDELKTELAAQARKSKQDVLDDLQSDRELARSLGQTSPAIRATELYGREVHGMFRDKLELSTSDYRDTPIAELRTIAHELAQELGMIARDPALPAPATTLDALELVEHPGSANQDASES